MSANDTSNISNISKDKLISDFRVVMADAEELLRLTASETGEKLAAARAKLNDKLRDARDSLERAEAVLIAKTKEAAKATDAYVQDNPWKAVGIAACIGLVVGLLIGRR